VCMCVCVCVCVRVCVAMCVSAGVRLSLCARYVQCPCECTRMRARYV